MDDYFRLLKVAIADVRYTKFTYAGKLCNSEVSKWNSTGNLGNGRLPLHLCELYTNELKLLSKDFVSLAMETYDAFDFPLDDLSRKAIIEFCVSELHVCKASFEEALFSNVPFNGNLNRNNDYLEKIRNLASTEMQAHLGACVVTMSAELETKMRKSKMEKSKISPVTVNVSGNVGNMQVGNYNNISVTQDNRVAFSNAFNQIREILKGTLPPSEYEQLNEVMSDCEVELQKEDPNFTKIKGLLAGVGSVIKGLPQVAASYEALKTLSTIFGVNLP